MSLWDSLQPRLREKAVKSIRHSLKTEIMSRMAVEDKIPVAEPVPALELNPDLLAAFLAEPEPDEIDLGPRWRSAKATGSKEDGVASGNSMPRSNLNDNRGEDGGEDAAAEDEEAGVYLDGRDKGGMDVDRKDENGKDDNGKDENGKDQNGKDDNGKDENGKDENGKDENGKDENGKDEGGMDDDSDMANPRLSEVVCDK